MQRPESKKLLYNPNNWAFLAFFLSPLLPAILFYRNSILLGTPKTGRQVLFGTIAYFLAFLIPIILFSHYAVLIVLAQAIISVIIAKKLAKTQIHAYDQMKIDKGLKGGRDDVPMILLFLALWVTIAFVIPFVINKYLEGAGTPRVQQNERIIVPRANPQEVSEQTATNPPTEVAEEPETAELVSSIQGEIKLSLPDGYILATENESFVEYSYQYEITPSPTSLNQNPWDVFIVPLEAVRNLDSVCAPGDCMRTFSIFPTEKDFVKDLNNLEAGGSSFVVAVDGQKYFTLTKPVDGDVGYIHYFITYLNDVRVVFSTWSESTTINQHTEFLSGLEIVSLN